MRFLEGDIVKLHKDFPFGDQHPKNIEGKVIRINNNNSIMYRINVAWDDFDSICRNYKENKLRLVRRP